MLDAVQNKETIDPQDDPRRLRPGEIDPNPETKAPRPDPIDMDEAEKEMLSEARARLANTKGKKAKRKAREKQLEEARRLANLQKRRELKLAGVPLPKQKKKMKGMDYNKEIPFLRKPAPGFYAVDYQEADQRIKEELANVPVETMEGKRRMEEEEENRKKDSKKMKIKEKSNAPDAIVQVSKANDAFQALVKSKMNLPAPQLTQEVLEDMARNEEEMNALTQFDENGSSATKSLLPSFSPAPGGVTPALGGFGKVGTGVARTPVRTPVRQDVLLKEAQNLIALSQHQTPLMGGSNPTLHATDFSGATPKARDIKTPNALVTSSTPGRKTGLTPGRTPVRDFLNINEEAKLAQLEEEYKSNNLKNQLRNQLKSLPAPQHEYKIVLPDDADMEQDDKPQEEREIDMADMQEYQRKKQRQREMEKMRKRSAALIKNLPRPSTLANIASVIQSDDKKLSEADRLIRQEMLALLIHEAHEYPFEGLDTQDLPPAPEHYSDVSLEQLSYAKSLIDQEALPDLEKKPSPDDFANAWQQCFDDFVYSASQGKPVKLSTLKKKEQVEYYSGQLEQLKEDMKEESERAKKMETKVSILHKGYVIRNNNMSQAIKNIYQELVQAGVELECFEKLREQELREIKARVDNLATEVSALEDRESRNQRVYQELAGKLEEIRHRANGNAMVAS